MGKMLKAEILYNRNVIFALVIMSLISLGLLHFWPVIIPKDRGAMNTGYLHLSHIVYYFGGALISSPWAKEKRPRLLFLLPERPFSARQVQLALYSLYWALLVSIYLLSAVLSPQYYFRMAEFHTLVLHSLFAVTAYFALILMRDTHRRYAVQKFSSKRRRIPLASAGYGTAVIIIGLAVTAGTVHRYQGRGDAHILDRILSWLYQSPYALLLILAITVLAAVLVFSREHRIDRV